MIRTGFTILLFSLLTWSLSGQSNAQTEHLMKVFSEVVKTYPSDSASLYKFYFKLGHSHDKKTVRKDIERLEGYLSKGNQDRYRAVEKQLKPLMVDVQAAKSMKEWQGRMFDVLFSDYDYFRGEGLFSQLLTKEDNYQLVWRCMEQMSTEAAHDTGFIVDLMDLDRNVSTNTELAEKMPYFVVKAIQNNPQGFLSMYMLRTEDEERKKLARFITGYEGSTRILITIYQRISASTSSVRIRNAANDLLKYLQYENE
jgi:hypothetical protein